MIKKLSIQSWHIHCVNRDGSQIRNEKGRTPFTLYLIRDGQVTIVTHGENMDSKSDRKDMDEMNRDMQEVHNDFVRKSGRSEQSAANVYLKR